MHIYTHLKKMSKVVYFLPITSLNFLNLLALAQICVKMFSDHIVGI